MCSLLAVVVAGFLAADFPLAVERVVPGPPSEVVLRNGGTQPVNAWSFAVSTPNANGGVHRVVYTADAYLSEVTSGLPQSVPHLDRLLPGQSRAFPIDPVSGTPSVQVVAVVLQDGTAMGEEATIKSLFDKRAFERDELRKVVDSFNTVLAAGHGMAALQDLATRLAQPDAGEESVPHRSAREAVDAFLQRAKSGGEDDAERSARTYATFVQRQYDLAVKQAQRK
jgi:hypothetical protein